MSEVKAKVSNRRIVDEPTLQKPPGSVVPVPTQRGIAGNRGVSQLEGNA
jgi:hypothetical protein